MVNSIGSGGGGLNQAFEAALKRMHGKTDDIGGQDVKSQDAAGFAEMLSNGVSEVDNSIQRSEQIHLEAVSGTMDLHEVSAQLKQSELSFQFAMQVRNKFIDAYREVMRMSV